MSQKTLRRMLRKDPPSDQKVIETTSSIAEENKYLSEQHFEDISFKN